MRVSRTCSDSVSYYIAVLFLFFNPTNTAEEENSTPIKLVPPEISYERDELLKLAERPLSKTLPDSWLSIAKKHPRIVKREGPTANLIAKEVRALKKQEEKTLVTKKI